MFQKMLAHSVEECRVGETERGGDNALGVFFYSHFSKTML